MAVKRTGEWTGINYLELSIGARAPVLVNAVIEVPKGESNKYEYDKDKKMEIGQQTRLR